MSHSSEDFLIRQGKADGDWSSDADPYETAAIPNGSVNQILITWLLYRKPANLMKAIGSVIDRTMTLLGPPAEPTSTAPAKARRRRA